MRKPEDFNLSSTTYTNACAAMTMHVGRITPSYNGNWFEFYPDGSTNGYKYGACHGSLNPKGTELVATMSPWGRVRYQSFATSYSKPAYRKPLAKPLLTRFYDWFVNRSWASEWIVAPSVEFARDVGIVIPSTIPANWGLAILAMSRIAGENAHNVVRMYDYVDKFGISEELAFFLSHAIQTENKYGSLIHGHSLFSPGVGPEALKTWLSRKFKQRNGSLSSGADRLGVNAMFGGGVSDVVKAWEPYKAKVEAGAVVIPNPFAPVAKVAVGQMTEDFLRSIIPNIKEAFDNAPTTAVSKPAAANPRVLRAA